MTIFKLSCSALFAVLIGIVGAEEATKETPQESTEETKADENSQALEIAKNYKNLTRMTKQPIQITVWLAMMCRMPSAQEIKGAQNRHGPHTMKRVNFYMNELAAKAVGKNPISFPVGSIIVKDKKLDDENDGVGGMIKREKGYDPEHGDWEYFYYTDIEKVGHGKIASCVECHSKTAHSDYFYGHWLKHGNGMKMQSNSVDEKESPAKSPSENH